MQMNQVIQERRRALGLTQEQVADALGVTAPAVNKWEKGTTCPDIALLAPLARLLEIDMNELMCFHESLTEQEVYRCALEIMQTAERDGLDAGFEHARRRLRRYPNSDSLAYSAAVLLQSLLSMAPDAGAREAYERQLMEWYARAAASGDAKLRDRASLMLANCGIVRKDWDAAQRAIEALPERPPMDRRSVQAQLCSAQGKPEEAAELLERVLLVAGQEVSSVLLCLVDAEIAAGDLAAAEAVAKASEAVMRALDLWIGQAAPLQLAVARKDVRQAVEQLRKFLAAIDRPWKPHESPLYRRIMPEGKSATLNERVFAPVLQDLTTNPDYEFLRGDAEFQELLEAYRQRIEK